MRFGVLVEVSLRPGIADPQGQTVERALPALGFDDVSGVHIGKAIRFTIDADDEATAHKRVEDLCDRFLTNPVIEDARIQLNPDFHTQTLASDAHEREQNPAGRTA